MVLPLAFRLDLVYLEVSLVGIGPPIRLAVPLPWKVHLGHGCTYPRETFLQPIRWG